MNNNNLGRVAVRTSARKCVSTPMGHDVNFTCGVGEIVPAMICEQVPKSTAHLKTRDLIRLATMAVPTAGRMKLNLRHYFVGMSDLTQNFAAFLARTPISRDATFTPMKLPWMSKAFLSLLSLVGAHVTLYRVAASSNDTSDTCQDQLYSFKVAPSATSPAPAETSQTFSSWFGNAAYQNVGGDNTLANGALYKQSMPVAWRDAWNGYSGPCLNIAKFIYSSVSWPTNQAQWEFWIPIENKNWASLFELRGIDEAAAFNPSAWAVYRSWNFSVVDLKTADCVVSIRQKGASTQNGVGHLACRFSNFGRRWMNLLISSGIGFDTSDYNSQKSLMPLFAYYKAYWESFGLTLYKKWETSNVVRLMRIWDDYGYEDFEKYVAWSLNSPSSLPTGVSASILTWFCNFVMDVCTAFYTEEQDFVSAHTRDAVVAPRIALNTESPFDGTTANLGNNQGRINVAAAGGGDSAPSPSAPLTAPVGYIAGTDNFTQLDIETLKRLYKVVNRNTIAGQSIAKILQNEGLGDYVDSVKSRFIGEFDVPIEVDEVTATSDAFDAAGDARSLLGEQGAKGIGFGRSKKFSNKTNEFGYYIVLASIVPESGYCNTELSQGSELNKLDFYNPEYDGLGMELNTKAMVVAGSQFFAESSADQSKVIGAQAFGFLPRYSRHKVRSNMMLGGFAQRSEKGYYDSYHLDKIIKLGEREVIADYETDESAIGEKLRIHELAKMCTPVRTPQASPNWRYVGRYPWIENYLRIFAATGDPKREVAQYFSNLSDFTSLIFDFCFRDEDKFIVQNRFELVMSAPWLKITDAFETKEDGNVGSTDVSIGKA